MELNEDPFAPDWGQIDRGNPRSVSDALFTIWQLLHPPGGITSLIFPGGTTQFLRADGTFAVPPQKVVQIVAAVYDTQTSSSSATLADTGLTATITPTSVSNKVLVLVIQAGCAKLTGNTGVQVELFRGATGIGRLASIAGDTGTTATNDVGAVAINVLDTPATVAATTYKTQFGSANGVATARVQTGSARSSIVLIEVTP